MVVEVFLSSLIAAPYALGGDEVLTPRIGDEAAGSSKSRTLLHARIDLQDRPVIRVADVAGVLRWWTRTMTTSDGRRTRSGFLRGPLQLGVLVLGIGLLAALPTLGIIAAAVYIRVWAGLQDGDATWNDRDGIFAIAGVVVGVILLVALVLAAVSICRRYRLKAWAWVPASVLSAACVSVVPLVMLTS